MRKQRTQGFLEYLFDERLLKDTSAYGKVKNAAKPVTNSWDHSSSISSIPQP